MDLDFSVVDVRIATISLQMKHMNKLTSGRAAKSMGTLCTKSFAISVQPAVDGASLIHFLLD